MGLAGLAPMRLVQGSVLQRPPGAGLADRPDWKKLTAKEVKNKQQILKCTRDCPHPVEDGITEAANFEQLPQERTEVKGKARNLGGGAVTDADTSPQRPRHYG